MLTMNEIFSDLDYIGSRKATDGSHVNSLGALSKLCGTRNLQLVLYLSEYEEIIVTFLHVSREAFVWCMLICLKHYAILCGTCYC